MYEKDGEKYFVVDGHMHYWNASADNWVPGNEQYAKGWIECLHAYQGLGPPETHWTIEHFQKCSEDDLLKDVFEDGHVDVAIFQPTDLKEWYKEGFNTTERNATVGVHRRGKFLYNTRWTAIPWKRGHFPLADSCNFGSSSEYRTPVHLRFLASACAPGTEAPDAPRPGRGRPGPARVSGPRGRSGLRGQGRPRRGRRREAVRSSLEAGGAAPYPRAARPPAWNAAATHK